jgi:hypothetical protein
MQPLIEDRRRDLVLLCRRFQVRRLDIFGSAARGEFDPSTSDLDFLVEFEDLQPIEYARAYFALKEALEKLFVRPVDLVTGPSVTNPYFEAGIAASRETVYEA